MINKKPNITFDGVGLGAEQRAFVNAVVTGKGFSNPVETKLRSVYRSVSTAIEKLNTNGLFGNDIISQDYQDLFQLKLQNLELALVQYWKHSNKLSGVVNSEIEELNRYDAVFSTTTPPPPRKSVVVGGSNGSSPTTSSDKSSVGCLSNIADFYNRLLTSINYCTAKSEMARETDCEFGPFGSIISSIDPLLDGVNRTVECGPGCCDPCTYLNCTGLDPVCFGLSGIVDHIVSVKNSIGGQQGIDAALALAYEYSLGVDRLTAEIYCLINRDDTNYCKESRYVERFALGQRISNDLIGGGPISSVLNSFFGTKVQ
jgi:hypothetical protein